MSTIWTDYILAITTDKAIGDAIGIILDPDPGVTEAFVTPLRTIGSTGSATAWFVAAPLTALGESAISEFEGNGPYPICNSIGINDALIVQGKPVLTMLHGPRSAYEEMGLTFIASSGYEIMETA